MGEANIPKHKPHYLPIFLVADHEIFNMAQSASPRYCTGCGRKSGCEGCCDRSLWKSLSNPWDRYCPRCQAHLGLCPKCHDWMYNLWMGYVFLFALFLVYLFSSEQIWIDGENGDHWKNTKQAVLTSYFCWNGPRIACAMDVSLSYTMDVGRYAVYRIRRAAADFIELLIPKEPPNFGYDTPSPVYMSEPVCDNANVFNK